MLKKIKELVSTEELKKLERLTISFLDYAEDMAEEHQVMTMNDWIKETDEFIKLGQALKKAGLVESGVDAKFVIQDGLVKVNGETELQRGKKIHDGDVISYNGETVKVSK